MKKRSIAFLLSLIMLLSLLTPTALAEGLFAPATVTAEQDKDNETPVEQPGDSEEEPIVPEENGENDSEVPDNGENQEANDQQDESGPATECTCNAAEGEEHAEDCPLYVAAESSVAELYSKLMAMQTQEEIVLAMMELSPETIAEFTDEQAAAIEAHYDSLSTTAAVSGDTMTPGDETVVGSSEVRYLTYDFTDAAPFMDPVEGGN